MRDRRPAKFTAPWTWAGPRLLVRSPRPTENNSSADAAVDASALARVYKTQPLCSISAAARLPTLLSASSKPRSSSRLSSENTLFICPECFRKAESMRALPGGVRAPIRTRRSSLLSTRLTKPFAKRRSTAILIEPGVRSTIGPIVLTGKGPLCSRTSSTPKSERPSPVSSIPAAAYLVSARIAFIMTSQTCSGSWLLWAIRNLNLLKVYAINYIDFNMLDDMIYGRRRKENLMRTVSAIARYLAGVIFLVFGLNGFLNFIPLPPPGGLAGQFMSALYATHYLWVIFAFQLVAGVLLLVNRYVPLAVAVLAPVIVNILSFHVLMAPSGLPLALFVAVLWAVIFVDVRPAFAALFQARVHALT